MVTGRPCVEPPERRRWAWTVLAIIALVLLIEFMDPLITWLTGGG